MTAQEALAILSNPNSEADMRAEAAAVLTPVQTLEDEFGCDPWDDDNYGSHPASREPSRVTRAARW